MRRSRKTLIITLSITFISMAILVIFTSKVIFRTAFSSVQELGDDKTYSISADLENYLETAKSVLWVAADSVDHMVQKGATLDEIVEYITRESSGTEEQFDDSYTGIYGVINGQYVDGVGWVPPEDYDPIARDWYKTTIAAKGDVVIVSPYVDAQTGNVIISIGKALSDNKNALALDLTLSGVQEIVENIQLNGYGYGFIINTDGMIISHPDKSQIGRYYNSTTEQKAFFDKVCEVKKGNFKMKLDGENCTVFVDEVMEQWHLVIITKDSELYKSPKYLLFVSIFINLFVFLLISTFYILGYRYEAKFNARMEEMKENEQKKDYEAKILKLEKSAADEANKAKSNFLADMSHEIRTPINAILGMNEMILHESDNEEITEYAGNIKNAGNTLLSIINTILDFSKIEHGRMHLVTAPFYTTHLLTGLYNSINERARAKGLELSFEIDETIPSQMIGDDVRINQIISNILTNAVKYTEKGNVTLSIENEGITDNNVKLLVSVKDTGIGIKKEDIDKLSISFERVDEKKNRHIEGTGLGISIVTRLLSMMNSELQIESIYGVGSKFYFELVLKIADFTPLGNYNVASENNTGSSSDSTISIRAPKARILITDDNQMNLKVAKNLMKLFNIHPDICSSGKETIERMKSSTYDILFLDHMMPEMDGIETLQSLCDLSLVNNTKIIALTANAVVGAREQYLEAGFDGYLSKPINVTELEKIFKLYLPKDIVEEIDDSSADPTVSLSDDASADPTVSLSDVSSFDESLSALGLNIHDGITYCGEDRDFYIEILRDYAAAANEKIQQLNKYLAAENLKDYKILIHSVKSASKTIGASELSEQARCLEVAATENDKDYIENNHSDVIGSYAKLAADIGNILC